MGVKTEGRNASNEDHQRTEGVGAKLKEMQPISEDVGAEAEVGAAKTTLSSKQDETVKVEVTWKITDFADKMRMKDSVSFSKV